jgi:hypothetical protein
VTVDRDFDSVASGQQAQDPKAHRLGTLHRFTAEVRSAGVGGMHRADNFRPVELRALTPETLQDFIAVEHPSAYIDSAYSRVVATLVQKREQRYPEFTGELAQRIAADGVQHETRFREIKDALSPFFGDLSYLRKKFREGEKQEAEAAAGPLRIIKNSLRSAYAAANENQFSRSAREIADARAAMNDLLTIGERLAASTKCIGIPFFKIWNGLP